MENNKNALKIFVTGGHATPAVACINELKSRGYNDIIYIGQKHSILFDKNVSSEYTLVTEKLGVPFENLIAGKLSLYFDLNSLIWILRLPIGFLHALLLHLKYKPSVVLTFGSHVGVPIAFWAAFFRIPVVAHEQTVTLGRATKLIQKYASKVCYSWENTADHEMYTLHPEKYVYTGNPIRKEIFEVKTNVFNFSDTNKKTIFITGGNQGAHAINEFIFKHIKRICEKYNVIHQTGSNTVYNDISKAEQIAREINENAIGYIPKPYIFVEDMAEAYSRSFVIFSRAGANTVAELLALRKNSILVPIPTTSGNEQFLNAELLRSLGMAIVLQQAEFDTLDLEEVLQQAETLQVKDEQVVRRISEAHEQAEKKIVNIVEEVIGQKT